MRSEQVRKMLHHAAGRFAPEEMGPAAAGKRVDDPVGAAGKMLLNTDGASRGNPGPAGAGAFLTKADGTVVGAYKKFLGETTNNYAEYSALILGLESAAAAGATEVEVRADSELMVRQLTGVYKVKHPDIRQLVEIVRDKERRFRRVTYRHIPREQNVVADRLSNEAIDEGA
ncbi:MAG: ribonuclease HI family protein [Deltaproteobacteria bacterium]|nr:ribonuclease HI family protein [Deltaproteobacteria bacterium]